MCNASATRSSRFRSYFVRRLDVCELFVGGGEVRGDSFLGGLLHSTRDCGGWRSRYLPQRPRWLPRSGINHPQPESLTFRFSPHVFDAGDRRDRFRLGFDSY
jgi:hypothetical protein